MDQFIQEGGVRVKHTVLQVEKYLQYKGRGLGYGVLRHFQQYFSYIVSVSFIGGGTRSTQRKPPTCRKLLTTFII